MTIEQEQNQTEQPIIPNYLVWSILATILCCLPTGIYAVVLSSKVDSLVAMGKIEEAKRTSDQAKKWVIISACTGAVFSVIYFVSMLCFGLSSR